MPFERLASERYDEWRLLYYTDTRQRLTFRLGQAFLNKFYPEETCPSLYYCTDEHLADKMIRQEFLLPYQV